MIVTLRWEVKHKVEHLKPYEPEVLTDEKLAAAG